jgi:hypothetical protein
VRAVLEDYRAPEKGGQRDTHFAAESHADGLMPQAHAKDGHRMQAEQLEREPDVLSNEDQSTQLIPARSGHCSPTTCPVVQAQARGSHSPHWGARLGGTGPFETSARRQRKHTPVGVTMRTTSTDPP